MTGSLLQAYTDLANLTGRRLPVRGEGTEYTLELMRYNKNDRGMSETS